MDICRAMNRACKYSKVHKGGGARLAADIDALVGVGEAIELRRRALGVGTHIFEVKPVANIDYILEVDALGDAVDAIASRAPDGVLYTIASHARARRRQVVQGLAGSAQDIGDGVLVVEHDAGKVAIDAVVDVDHVAFSVERGVLHGAAGNDIASNSERSGDIVASRLGNNVDVGAGREEFIERSVQDTGHLLKGVAGEATAHVEGAEVEAVGSSLFKDGVGVTDSSVECHGVGGTRANVEADADDLETKLLGKGEEAVGGVHGSAKLHAEAAQAGRVVRHDAQEELGARVELGNLIKFVGIVKGHLFDSGRLDVANVGVGLARLGINNAVGCGAHGKDLLNLGLGCAVKAGA